MLTRGRLPSLAVALVLMSAPLAYADSSADGDVTLTGVQTGSSLTGRLVSYDDRVFVIQTRIGELSIARDTVTCSGTACPGAVGSPVSAPAAAADGDIRFNLDVVVTDPQLLALLQTMTGRFAEGEGLNALAVPSPRGAVERIEIFSETMTAIGQSGMTLATMNRADSLRAIRQGQVGLALDSSGGKSEHDNADLPTHRVLALDALIPVVHPTNPVRAVSVEELAEIAAGRISNWAELGGMDSPIRVVLPERDGALDNALESLVLRPSRVRLRSRFGIERMSETDAIAAVSSDPTAITFAGMTAAKKGRILPIHQSCGPLAMPTPFSVKTEEYPLTRRIMSYEGDASGRDTEQAFLDFLSSDEAQGVVGQLGFVDQRIITAPLSEQGGRLAAAMLGAEDDLALRKIQDLARMLINADRLSTTFRFQDGSLDLDEKSQADLARVVDYLMSPEVANRRVLILGFTDEVGRFDLNANRALLKAKSVLSGLLGTAGGAALEGRVDLSAYGPLAPVACNDTAQGRAANRRVEIWLL